MNHNLQTNKQNAMAFYKTAYLGDPEQATSSLPHQNYPDRAPHQGIYTKN